MAGMQSRAILICGSRQVEVVVNDRGEVAVKTTDGGWGWVEPVGVQDMALSLVGAHAPVDGPA